MKILFWGLFIFCLAFILHLVVWKVLLPKRQIKVMLQIFFGFLAFGILFLINTSSIIPELDNLVPQKMSEYIHICLIFISLTLSYMITYSALEADSPTLVMVMTIKKAGQKGLDKRKFDQKLNDDILVKPRIKDLITDKMAYLDGEKYKLTSKGRLMARTFMLYRKLLNAPKGG